MPKSSRDPGENIVGGLAGVASTFLGVKLNKRQQLSNWERRPLTEEQAIYAGKNVYLDLCKLCTNYDYQLVMPTVY